MDPLTDELCRWSAPDGAASIFLAASTVRDLRAKVIEAFLLLPRRGVETGGLLFGSGHSGQLFIHGFEEITCEHRYGPSFTLSADEQAALTEKLTRLQRKSEPGVIGLYRSYTGRAPELDAADLELVREHFPKGLFVFLLLQPLNAQSCRAGFRVCQDGELLAQPVFTPVPFDPELFSSEQFNGGDYTPELDTAPELEPDPEPRAEPVPQPVQFAPTPADPIPAPLASPEPAPPPPVVRQLPPPYRSIFAVPAAPEPVVPQAPRAKLRWWLPVLLCLVGAIGGAAFYELWALSRQPRWVDLYLDAKPSADAGSLVITWDAAASRTVGATHALLGVNDGAVHRDIPLTLSQLQLGRYLYTPANPELELRMVLYGDGPAVSGGTLRFAGAPRPALAAAAPTAPAPAAAPPKPAPPEEPAPDNGAKRAAIHEVQPTVPAGIRNRLTHQLEIPVIVRINARGTVTSASTSPTGDGLRRYLAQEAVKAARQWRFAPTHTSSERTLYFTFAQ